MAKNLVPLMRNKYLCLDGRVTGARSGSLLARPEVFEDKAEHETGFQCLLSTEPMMIIALR